MTVVNCHKKSS